MEELPSYQARPKGWKSIFIGSLQSTTFRGPCMTKAW